jgi:hypothetical protein
MLYLNNLDYDRWLQDTESCVKIKAVKIYVVLFSFLELFLVYFPVDARRDALQCVSTAVYRPHPADSKLAISFKKADSIIGKAIAQPVPSPNRKSSCNRDRTPR